MTLERPPGLWVAPFVVDGSMHVFPLDPLQAETGVGGWLNARSTCRDATIEAGAQLATKSEAIGHPRFCPGCWTWLLGHIDCHLIYAPEPGASIAEPEAVAARDLAELGWFVS